MQIVSTYSVKIKHYNHIFKDTIAIYRKAVDFFLDIILKEWKGISELSGQKLRVNALEHLTNRTKKNPMPKYDFGINFYKFPSYLRRAAIAEAFGKVDSYKSNLKTWEKAERSTRGKEPDLPSAGFIYPALYKSNMYTRDSAYTSRIKVYIRNTWDYIIYKEKRKDQISKDYICGKRGKYKE